MMPLVKFFFLCLRVISQISYITVLLTIHKDIIEKDYFLKPLHRFLFSGCGIIVRHQYSLQQPIHYTNYNQERLDGCQRQKGGYSCHKCGNNFTRRNNLYNHLKFQCGQLPRFNCPYCSYRTRHSSNVRSHIRRIHPDERIYVLDVYSKHDGQAKWNERNKRMHLRVN